MKEVWKFVRHPKQKGISSDCQAMSSDLNLFDSDDEDEEGDDDDEAMIKNY